MAWRGVASAARPAQYESPRVSSRLRPVGQPQVCQGWKARCDAFFIVCAVRYDAIRRDTTRYDDRPHNTSTLQGAWHPFRRFPSRGHQLCEERPIQHCSSHQGERLVALMTLLARRIAQQHRNAKPRRCLLAALTALLLSDMTFQE